MSVEFTRKIVDKSSQSGSCAQIWGQTTRIRFENRPLVPGALCQRYG